MALVTPRPDTIPLNGRRASPYACSTPNSMAGVKRASPGPLVLLLGPHRDAMSGVSTHLNLLLGSTLSDQFRLKHFQIGSEGHAEGRAARLVRLLASPFKLAYTLLSQRVRIIHLNTSLNRRAYWRDLSYMLVARLLGVRVLYQVHGGDLPEQFSAHNRLLASLLRATLRLPEAIVVLARSELKAYSHFLPGALIRLLPNSIDAVPYTQLQRQTAPAQEGLQLLYLGRLARDKGLFEALHALRLARLQGATAKLIIAGGGPDEAGLRQTVKDLHLESHVNFVGPVFAEAKLNLFSRADVLLLPSYSEGLPYALLECMAAGLPAIVTPVGAIPDVVIDIEHGLLVPPRDVPAIARAIVRLAANPQLVVEMGHNCRQRIANTYSLPNMVRDFTQMYAELSSVSRA